jgi:hypothetical protein
MNFYSPINVRIRTNCPLNGTFPVLCFLVKKGKKEPAEQDHLPKYNNERNLCLKSLSIFRLIVKECTFIQQ